MSAISVNLSEEFAELVFSCLSLRLPIEGNVLSSVFCHVSNGVDTFPEGDHLHLHPSEHDGG